MHTPKEFIIKTETTPIGYFVYQILKARFPEKSISDLAKMLKIGRPALSSFLHHRSDLSIKLAHRIEGLTGYSARSLLIAQLDYNLFIFRSVTYLNEER
jgi:plasmid maintenance system antidote protein VapI